MDPDATTEWIVLLDVNAIPYIWNDAASWDDGAAWYEGNQWSDLATGDPTDEV